MFASNWLSAIGYAKSRGMRLLVTGGCGFIGSNFIRYVLEHYQPESVTNVDLLTYAGALVTTADFPLRFGERYEFIRADIADRKAMEEIISRHSYYAVVNFAAESHVDRSIVSPADFIHSNVVGTTVLLETARDNGVKRLVQISTDEVYGSNESAIPSSEAAVLNPSSPYSASKAAADLLALAYHKTYGLDVVVTRCSNNYGQHQFPEKLIPLMIANALEGKKLPVYGDGLHVRDWIHVEDHCSALVAALELGKGGEVYNVGCDNEWPNLQIVGRLLDILGKARDLIEHVRDRPGHDRRYAIDSAKANRELGWAPRIAFADGLLSTVEWYVKNRGWWERVRTGEYRTYYDR